MGHCFKRCHLDPAADIFAHGNRKLGGRTQKLLALQDLAQTDQLSPLIGNFYANGRFPGNSLNQHALALQAQT